MKALEKKNAEALGLLRQSQEIRLLEAVKAVREKQIEGLNENLKGVKRAWNYRRSGKSIMRVRNS